MRPLVTKHRTAIEKALFGVAAIESGFDIGANHAGRALGTQRLIVLALGLGCARHLIQLLLHNVGGFAAGSFVQLDAFQSGNPNFVERVPISHRARAILDHAERTRVGAQIVLKAS